MKTDGSKTLVNKSDYNTQSTYSKNLYIVIFIIKSYIYSLYIVFVLFCLHLVFIVFLFTSLKIQRLNHE